MKLFFIFLVSLALMGCGFHLRGTQGIPPQLNTLYLDVDKPDTPFNQSLKNLLTSLHINLTKSPEAAPLVLKSTYTFSHSTPTLTTSTQTVAFAYVLRVFVSLTTPEGRVVVPTFPITLTRTLTINSDQIYTPNIASLVENDLQRSAINLIYYWLINTDTTAALATAIPGSAPNTSVNAPSLSTTQMVQGCTMPPQQSSSMPLQKNCSFPSTISKNVLITPVSQ